MAKSADAFRTISEVADWLGTPAHVLRFWESKFSQIKPVKRAGGRRYYRPADMALIGGIKKLLHDDGMTIKGVQKILRDQGVKHVAALSQPLGDEIDAGTDTIEATATPAAQAADDTTVVQFQRDHDTAEPPETAETTAPESSAAPDDTEGALPGAPAADTSVLEDFAGGATETPAPAEPPEHAAEAEPESAQPEAAEAAAEEPATEQPAAEPASELPAFLHGATRPEPELAAESEQEPEPEPEPAPLRAETIETPPDPGDTDIAAPPGLLAAIAARRGRPLTGNALSAAIALRDQLAAQDARHRGAGQE